MKFFSAELAEELVREGMQADLLVGSNVVAQVLDLCSFVESMKTLLRPNGMNDARVPLSDAVCAIGIFDLPYIFANFAPQFP